MIKVLVYDDNLGRRESLMAITDAPKIISSRFDLADGHTLERYEATGGYEGLKAALTKPPSAVVDEVKSASLLGRGGAGFPAGRKWRIVLRGSLQI